jgi:hypothetical protein
VKVEDVVASVVVEVQEEVEVALVVVDGVDEVRLPDVVHIILDH